MQSLSVIFSSLLVQWMFCAAPTALGSDPTQEDLHILQEALRILEEPDNWNSSCERLTDRGHSKHSLYSALREASFEVTGSYDHRRLGLEVVRSLVPNPDGLFEHRLRDFNNTRSHGEVLCLLRAAIDECAERLYFKDNPGEPALVGLRRNDEFELELRGMSRRFPRWCELQSIGKSVEGRDIWVLRITDPDSSDKKTGVWIDGGIHGCEIASPEPAMGLVESLAVDLEQCEPPAWLRRVELFIAPLLNPDGRAISKRPPYAVHRGNLQPVDDDGDGRVDEERYKDLNEDGRIGRLVAARSMGNYEGTDSDHDGSYGEDLPGGIDLNRDYPVASLERDSKWKPQPETRAVVEFVEATPHIVLAVSYHTSRDMFITPYAETPIDARYSAMADLYLSHFIEGDVWHLSVEADKYGIANPRQGMNIEWFHFSRGVPAFIVEIGPNDFTSDRYLKRTSVDKRLQAYAFTPGYYARDVETRLEHRIEAVRREHAQFLRDLIRTFGTRPL